MSEKTNGSALRWLDPAENGSKAIGISCFFILSSGISAICWWLGPYSITLYPKDTAYLLIQGDFLLRGYEPYSDYYSMHGPFPFLFAAAAMHFCGISLRAVILTQIFGSIALGCLMLRIAINRVNQVWAVFLSLSVELILMSCTPLSYKVWREFTCAMWYNSVGYCLSSIVFLFLLAPSRNSSQLAKFMDWCSIALCLAASLLTKMTYFAPLACVFVLGTLVFPRNEKTRLGGLVAFAGCLGLASLLMNALGSTLSDYLEFLHWISIKVHPLLMILQFLQYTQTPGLFLLGLLAAGWYVFENHLFRAVYREFLLAIFMLGALLAAASTSAQGKELLPMLGTVPLGIYLVMVAVSRDRAIQPNKYLLATLLCTSFLLVAHPPKNSALSWIFSHTRVPMMTDPTAHTSRESVEVLRDYLSDRLDINFLLCMPKEWTEEQLDGVALLSRNRYAKDSPLFVAIDTGPINMLIDAEYSKGQVAWWPFVFAESPHKFTLLREDFLEDTSWILRSKSDENVWEYLTIYRNEMIEREFEQIDESKAWILYKRKQAS